MTGTSNIGAFVRSDYILSTALCTRWAALANIYQRWRINKLRLTYVSQIGTGNNGRVAMCVNEDPDGGVPVSFPDMIQFRCAQECTGYARVSMVYKPKHESFLWTGDLVANEDRLEYPGYLYVATGSFTSSVVPGYIIVESWTEWDAPCSTNTALDVEPPLLSPEHIARGKREKREPRGLSTGPGATPREPKEQPSQPVTTFDPARPRITSEQLMDVLMLAIQKFAPLVVGQETTSSSETE